jgi:hypothetical protein
MTDPGITASTKPGAHQSSHRSRGDSELAPNRARRVGRGILTGLRPLLRSRYVAYVLGVALLVGWVAFNRMSRPDSSQVVIRLERRGERIYEDEGLEAELSGLLALDDASVLSA